MTLWFMHQQLKELKFCDTLIVYSSDSEHQNLDSVLHFLTDVGRRAATVRPNFFIDRLVRGLKRVITTVQPQRDNDTKALTTDARTQ